MQAFDETWRAEALAGRSDAVATLAAYATERLWRFCFYRLNRDGHLCEDAVQDTLVRAIRELSQYDPTRSGGDIFPWLTGLARNEIRRVLSTRPKTSLDDLWGRMDRELLDVFARLDREPLPHESLEREETRQLVGAAMSQLPAQYGAALEAKYLLGQSVREMAASLRMSEKAVESQLTRARVAFRETFLAIVRNLPLSPAET